MGPLVTYRPPTWPVSIKGVAVDAHGRVLLLKNERQEWELPGGRLASVRLVAARAAPAHRQQGIGVGDELDGIRRESVQRSGLRLARRLRRAGEQFDGNCGHEPFHLLPYWQGH